MEGRTILLVDDDPHVIRSLTFMLNKEGYETVVATDGEDAMEKLRQLKPRVMFLDVMMPKKNGYEVVRELRSDPDLGDVHVVLLTAKGQEADREKGLSLGADEFVTKPFSPRSILDKVRALLG
ncbi:MAG: two-component system response regulator [Chloroflexi bacterium]|nr:MAG: two-component system response regulator [Chloroflexota bacterium]RLC96262.1 MAG: two-component system response regulator [Chloroflexota bacterium]